MGIPPWGHRTQFLEGGPSPGGYAQAGMRPRLLGEEEVAGDRLHHKSYKKKGFWQDCSRGTVRTQQSGIVSLRDSVHVCSPSSGCAL